MNTLINDKKVTKAELTKRRIVDAFLDYIPEKKWDKISVKEICSSANITRGTFYQYFNDIYDLMEQLETALLEDIINRYETIPKCPAPSFPIEEFIEQYDYAPPKYFLVWFDYCRENKKAITCLLDRKHGDTYFVKKLKTIISQQVNESMDQDGLPRDELRPHFVKILLELHFLSAQTWLESGDDTVLSVNDIVNLLNTMRVGSSYLTYKRLCDPDYDKKIPSPQFDI